jgi:hypothetical protein
MAYLIVNDTNATQPIQFENVKDWKAQGEYECQFVPLFDANTYDACVRNYVALQ